MDFLKLLSRPSRTTKLLVLALSTVLLVYLLSGTDVVPPRLSGDKSPVVSTTTTELPKGDSSSPTMAAVDLSWHPPAQTLINNLTHVVSNSTTGVYGFIYDSSHTPDEAYGTYNWCNMPHVRATEYKVPPDEYELVYVELIHRHHKRTPYAANSFPVESYTWDCDDQGLYFFARPFSDPSSPDPNAGRNASALAYWAGSSGFNPFGAAAQGFKGSCQFPQITAQGLDDSWQHGADLYGAYHDLLGFLPSRDDPAWRRRVKYRVTNNVITSEVAGMVINGMWRTAGSVPLHIQPAGVDSLEPSYACASAAARFAALASPATNADWAAHFDAAGGLYAALDGISGVEPSDSGFHKSFDHYYDNLSARQCHGRPLPCRVGSGNDTGPGQCVTQALADEVYRLGHWEYSHTYRGAGPDALAASASSLGVWVAELAAHLRDAAAGGGGGGGPDGTLWFHNVAHDGSVSRLLGVLQADVMVWPGMGSEVVFELWAKGGEHFVRVLFGGVVLESSNPSLGVLDMIPVGTLLAYFDGLVGVKADLVVDKCKDSS
ncbi:hypothetical protein KVR01_006431 [Diaporthe batatas]|uniref:uncharacterized protein n=1 Tax=Diaporthe batatas TaxID=748121 RepID=UPI001D047C66|nr:uncharacterized protein KVR01_006431 [Diaporthe batatas]KAG8164513.1 hypothetical protein KVR01_006431 [Diaporthe batatas]